MSKLTFTVAAILAARASAQQQCAQPPHPVPAQDQQDYKLQEAANFAYMDQCSEDGAISWYEYESFSPALSQTIRTRDEMIRDFQKMDLNNDNQLSAEERLRYLQVVNAPLDLQGHLAPYLPIADELFSYMDCRPQPGSEDSCDGKYDRDDLKAVLPILVDIADIYADHIEYEAYVSHEFSLRDYNHDGFITRDEQDRHTWHYRYMRYFWNYNKDQGDDNYETMADDNGIMEYSAWHQQDNRMIRRDYCDDAAVCPISDEEFQSRFRYFDLNQDGQLSWWEYFSRIQEDDLRYHSWRPIFHSFIEGCETSQDAQGCGHGEGKITMSDAIRTYTSQNPDLTAAEIQQLADAFFTKYNREQDTAEIDGVQQQYVGFWEMWGLYNYEVGVEVRDNRRQEKQEITFKQNFWFNYDLNRDMQILFQELTASGMSNDQATWLFDYLQTSVSLPLTYETTKNGMISLEEDRAPTLVSSWLVLRNDDAAEPVTLASIDINSPRVQDTLLVQDQVELTQLFVQIDTNADGELVFEEACRHYILDSDYFCSNRAEPVRYEFEAGSWDEFKSQIDINYVSGLATGDVHILEGDWAAAMYEVSLFEDMDAQQIADKFDMFDQNDDGKVDAQEIHEQNFNNGA